MRGQEPSPVDVASTSRERRGMPLPLTR